MAQGAVTAMEDAAALSPLHHGYDAWTTPFPDRPVVAASDCLGN